jgi:hypothetical protein
MEISPVDVSVDSISCFVMAVNVNKYINETIKKPELLSRLFISLKNTSKQ